MWKGPRSEKADGAIGAREPPRQRWSLVVMLENSGAEEFKARLNAPQIKLMKD
jgi:hypothetical protein